jgi:glycosyltransferase involved in cell wall biosynthesis
MRVVILSKTFVAPPSQRMLEWLARRPAIDLTLITPPCWHGDDGGMHHFQPTYTAGYRVVTLPIARNGHYHLYTYRHLAATLDGIQPDLVHIDEEPYNLATFQATRLARRRGIPTVIVAWQNLARRYPPPFAWMERYAYRHAAAIIAGNAGAADVARRKGWRGPLHTFSVHGIDPADWPPRGCAPPAPDAPFTVGYVGRLVPEKGVDLLLHALVRMPDRVRLAVIGRGPVAAELRAMAADLGVGARVAWQDYVAPLELPQTMRTLDALALPSRTRPNWTEQFGRVLAEAMASGVPVIGAASGAIPDVIGDAGLLFSADDATALAGCIATLAGDPTRWRALAQRGRTRALAEFTYARIAARLANVYAGGRGATPAPPAVLREPCSLSADGEGR